MEYMYIFLVIKVLFFFSCVTVFYVSKTLHAVFMLIFSFVLASCICILLEAYFIAFLLIIVYVGAIAVLFLFTLMLLNFKDPSANEISEIQKKSVVLILSSCFFIFSLTFKRMYFVSPDKNFSFLDFFVNQPNTFIISQMLYSHNAVAFILSGLILFVAMLGAIILTSFSLTGPGGSESNFAKIHTYKIIGEQNMTEKAGILSESVVLKIPKIIK